MKEQIIAIAEKLRSEQIDAKKAKKILLHLFGVTGELPVGTKVVYRGKAMKITNNNGRYGGCAAYRCDNIPDELYLIEDFDSIDYNI